MSETLRQKQSRFARQAARLVLKAYELGYEVTLGEAWRDPEQAALNAQHGTGIKNSLHIEKLAIDINLFKDGRYLEDEEGHRELGAWWLTFGPDYRWGGNFAKKDFNHYSITPDGVRA
jgi:hypothetical protein